MLSSIRENPVGDERGHDAGQQSATRVHRLRGLAVAAETPRRGERAARQVGGGGVVPCDDQEARPVLANSVVGGREATAERQNPSGPVEVQPDASRAIWTFGNQGEITLRRTTRPRREPTSRATVIVELSGRGDCRRNPRVDSNRRRGERAAAKRAGRENRHRARGVQRTVCRDAPLLHEVDAEPQAAVLPEYLYPMTKVLGVESDASESPYRGVAVADAQSLVERT